jgi:serine/threonine-protein kinase
MELYCTRPGCPRPKQNCVGLDDLKTLKSVEQKYCTTCGMPLLLQGRYLTTGLLGQGGFGAAFLARDRFTPGLRQCVVKQFKPSMPLNPQQLELAQTLFHREAEVLEQLGNEHPQIPDLLAFFDLSVPNTQLGREDRFFYLVQEFIDGQTLEEELQQQGPFSEAAVLEVLSSMLQVLQFVHEHQVIHRDIKPSNIMRDRRGRLYLLDFGAIKNVAQAGQQTSTSIFSQGYAPPEQMAGQAVSFSSDLYALAATAVVLLTGKEPQELFDASRQAWNWQPWARVSDRTALILNKLLQADPNQRAKSAAAVLSVLQPALSTSSGQPAAPAVGPTTRVQPAPAAVSVPPPAAVAVPPPPGPIAPFSPTQPAFSTLEYLGNAAFTGFQGGVLAIALFKYLPWPLPTPVRALIWLVIALVLVYLQSRRIIERIDLLIIAAITIAAVALIFKPEPSTLIIAVVVGIFLAIDAAVIFRLVYRLLSRLLNV